MAVMDIEIRLTSIDEIVELRWKILRTGLPRESASFPGDELSTTLHIGAFDADLCVGCASFMQNEWDGAPAWQLRGMAVEESYRSQGIGREILVFADEQIRQRGYSSQLWCNARTPAVRFYQTVGWQTTGDEFVIPTAGPHFKMHRVLPAI
jgi:GNAT superfamily N-acetyltransferase